MLRSSFLVFVTGWAVWFWIDKPAAGQFRLPESGDSMLANFQTAFDMLKAGYPALSFVYIWNAHYIVLSLLGGALLAVIYGGIGDYLGRRRMRRHFQAPVRRQGQVADKLQPDQDTDPAE